MKTLGDVLGRVRPENRPPTGVVASLYERTPIQRDLNALINQYLETPVLRERLAPRIEEKLAELKATNGGGHSNGPWLIATLESSVAYAFGDAEKALQLDRRALEFSREEWQRAISLGNISDMMRSLGQPADAIGPALEAIEIDPTNPGFWANLTLAVAAATRPEDLRIVLGEVLQNFGNNDPAWSVFIESHRQEFENMARLCPAETSSLFAHFGVSRGSEGAAR